jgi:hypothetical protein
MTETFSFKIDDLETGVYVTRFETIAKNSKMALENYLKFKNLDLKVKKSGDREIRFVVYKVAENARRQYYKVIESV